MNRLASQLEDRGLHLSTDGLAQLAGAAGCVDAQKIYERALASDLKKVAAPILPSDVNTVKDGHIAGPLLLQVVAVENAAQPTDKQDHSPVLLQVRLTDGHTKCCAVAYYSMRAVSLSTPPGTKLILTDCQIKSGKILCGDCNTSVAGGRVMSLAGSWEANRELKRARAELKKGEDGPPDFMDIFRTESVAGSKPRPRVAATLGGKDALNARGDQGDEQQLGAAAVAAFEAIFGDAPPPVGLHAGSGQQDGAGGGGMPAATEGLGLGPGFVTASNSLDRAGYEDVMAERQRSADFEVAAEQARIGWYIDVVRIYRREVVDQSRTGARQRADYGPRG